MKNNQSTLLNQFKKISYCFTNTQDGNLAFHVGDDIKTVDENHNKLSQKLGYDKEKLVHMKQVHSDIVHIVNDDDNYKNPPTCDALITDKKDIPLMVMVADCTPILFYDSKKDVIAVAHVGRQGAFKNIIKKLIECFQNNYHSDAKDIYVAIGANICKNCYEVGDEIYQEAKRLNLEYAIDVIDDRFYLDIGKIINSQLSNLGINENNIENSNECSCCQNDKYFSYRADKKTGRFAGIILQK
jgi:YfiH family protein